MAVDVTEIGTTNWAAYFTVSPELVVESVLECEPIGDGLGGIPLRETPVATPYAKYDSDETAVNCGIEQHRPWELTRGNGDRLTELLDRWLQQVWVLTTWLRPFVPETCRGVEERLFAGPLRKVSPLFPRRP